MSNDFTDRQIIDKPLEDVWAFLTDFKEAKRWMTGINEMRLLEDREPTLGSELVFYVRKIERFSRVTAWEPQKKIAITTTQEGVKTTHEFTLSTKRRQTELCLKAFCRAEGKGHLVYSVVLMSMRKTTADYLDNFKKAIEEKTEA